MNPRPRIRRRRSLRVCLHSRFRRRLRTKPRSPAASPEKSRRHASGRSVTASPQNDGLLPSRRQAWEDRSLVIKQRERSQNSQLRIFHRFYEEMEPRHAFLDLIPPSKPSRPQLGYFNSTTRYPPRARRGPPRAQRAALRRSRPSAPSAALCEREQAALRAQRGPPRAQRAALRQSRPTAPHAGAAT